MNEHRTVALTIDGVEVSLRVPTRPPGTPPAEPLEPTRCPVNPAWRILPPLFISVLRHLAVNGSATREEVADALNLSAGGRAKYALSFLAQMDIVSSRGGYRLLVPEGTSYEDYRACLLAWLDTQEAEEPATERQQDADVVEDEDDGPPDQGLAERIAAARAAKARANGRQWDD